MKKLVSLALVLALVLVGMFATVASAEGIAKDEIKVGAILLHDENVGYDQMHYEGILSMVESLGLDPETQLIVKFNIPEAEACYDAAVDLAELGCDIIFADSFGHESFILQAAAEYPEIQFCHATGFQAATSGLSNMHNFFTSVYESRYVTGVVAGMKLNEMIAAGKITPEQAVMGYVGAYPYAEVISGYTAFYLGAKSVCPTVTMKVQYTNSWADMAMEKEAAEAMIAQGCVLISQHADTTGAPTACEALGVPCVGYNVSMISVAPTCALTSAAVNWAPYYTHAVDCMLKGTEIETDWCKGYTEGANEIKELNEAAIAEGTKEAVADIEAKLASGELHVFDCSTFTVGGKALTEEDSQYVWDGYFHESELASAPAFSYIIDGITALN